MTSEQREQGTLGGGTSAQWLESVLYVVTIDVAMALLPSSANRSAVVLMAVAYAGLTAVRYWRTGKQGAGAGRPDLAGTLYVVLTCTAVLLLPFLVALLVAGLLTVAYLGSAVARSRRAGRQGGSGAG